MEMVISTINSLMFICIGGLLGTAFYLFISLIYHCKRYNRKQERIERKLLKADIKRRKQLNAYSPNYSSDYDRSLDDLLKSLEGKHGKNR